MGLRWRGRHSCCDLAHPTGQLETLGKEPLPNTADGAGERWRCEAGRGPKRLPYLQPITGTIICNYLHFYTSEMKTGMVNTHTHTAHTHICRFILTLKGCANGPRSSQWKPISLKWMKVIRLLWWGSCVCYNCPDRYCCAAVIGIICSCIIKLMPIVLYSNTNLLKV